MPSSGATWVSVHHGGGVGIGYSLHAGMVIVADGSRGGGRELERVLTCDPGIGVARHADAGYPRLSGRPRSITSSCPWGRHESRSNHADPTAGTRAPAHRTHRGVALPCSRRDGIVRQRPYNRAQRHPRSRGPRTMPVRGPRTGGDDAGALPPRALPRFSVCRPRRAADGDSREAFDATLAFFTGARTQAGEPATFRSTKCSSSARSRTSRDCGT